MTWVTVVAEKGTREFHLSPRPLGRGGFGTVFRATDRLGAEFALKLIERAEDQARAAQQHREFQREASVLQQLRHPNIVRYVLHGDVAQAPIGDHRGALALVMEYVDGETLRDLIGPGGVGQDQALRYVTQLCRGLNEIHTARPPLVHRDIKPGNLVIGERDEVLRIVDFGLGRDLRTPIKAASAAAGTPMYMSPEQLSGGAIDPRTDLYAAGLVAYELVTGVVPMCDAVGYPDRRARAAGWMAENSGLPASLTRFFIQALAADPARRFQSAEALMRAFESSVKSSPSARPGPAVTPQGRGGDRIPILQGRRWEDYRDDCIAALAREAEAVKADLRARGADQPVEVRDGRREDRAPDWSVYAVQSPKDLIVAEDTPLIALINGERVRGRVLGCDPDQGTMRLALDQDQGPEFVRAMVQFDATFILERLRERLEVGDEHQNTALALALTRNAGRVDDASPASVVGSANLNEKQRDAVRRAIGSTVSYVWGPPGTGKTRTVGHVIASLLAQPGRVAALAPTNVATDTLLLAAAGVPAETMREAIATGLVVRLGESSPEIRRQRLHLDWAFECTARESKSQLVEAIDQLWAEAGSLRRKGRPGGKESPAGEPLLRARFQILQREIAQAQQHGGEKETPHHQGVMTLAQRLAAMKPAVDELEAAALLRATLIVTTLSKFHLDVRLHGQKFDSVIVDEVSMALYPALIYAACQGRRRITVAGDFKQLAPVVISDDPHVRRWLGHDIFELAGVDDEEGEIPARPLLAIQYRMHPEISGVVSSLFYAGRLTDSADVLKRHPTYRGADGPVDRSALALLDTTGPDTRSEKTQANSRVNTRHATVVAEVVAKAVSAGTRNIAVITPYVAQARLIRDAIHRHGPSLLGGTRISTVHRFQGQEADLVIFDSVDAPDIPVGFLNKPDSSRIVNVAISRARDRLLVVAHAEFLGRQLSHRMQLRRLLADIRNRGSEFPLALDGTASLDRWLQHPEPGKLYLVLANEWVRWHGQEALVVAVHDNRVRVLHDGREVEVPMEKVEAVFRNGRWVPIV